MVFVMNSACAHRNRVGKRARRGGAGCPLRRTRGLSEKVWEPPDVDDSESGSLARLVLLC